MGDALRRSDAPLDWAAVGRAFGLVLLAGAVGWVARISDHYVTSEATISSLQARLTALELRLETLESYLPVGPPAPGRKE